MALYFSDQYVHVNGEDIKIPPHILKEHDYICLKQDKHNHIYVNGYKYNIKNKTWDKSFIGRWLMTSKDISKLQIIIGIIMVLAIIVIAINGGK